VFSPLLLQNLRDFREILLCFLENRQHTVAVHHFGAGKRRIEGTFARLHAASKSGSAPPEEKPHVLTFPPPYSAIILRQPKRLFRAGESVGCAQNRSKDTHTVNPFPVNSSTFCC